MFVQSINIMQDAEVQQAGTYIPITLLQSTFIGRLLNEYLVQSSEWSSDKNCRQIIKFHQE